MITDSHGPAFPVQELYTGHEGQLTAGNCEHGLTRLEYATIQLIANGWRAWQGNESFMRVNVKKAINLARIILDECGQA